MPTTIDSNYEIISEEFANKYKDIKPNWGFNNLGFIIYRRTYSRIKFNGQNEEWHETVRRCINGAQKIGAKYTKEEAERLFDLVFNLKCNFAGRSLWQLGTSTIDRFGGIANSLINCFFLSIKEPEDFCFLFENLMMGAGVGFSVRRENIHELPKVKSGVKIAHELTKDAEFIVPDSREGWVELLRKVLKSFFTTGKNFNYSTILVRGYGEPIKGFGGTASGPQILIDGISKIAGVLSSREGKKLRSIDVLDIANIIGSIVVAGNVRRSSEIALGDADDHLFIRAKRWDLGTIPNWRAMSNNTICADDFSYLSDGIWDGYAGNGEPYGLFNLPLSRQYGRLGEEIKDDVEGTNPCCFAVNSEVLIKTRDGIKEIKSVTSKDLVYITNAFYGEGWVPNSGYFKAGKAGVYNVKFSNGQEFIVTLNHTFATRGGHGEYFELTPLALLKVGDKIVTDLADFTEIVSISYSGNEEVGCIHVPSYGFFATAGGIISGNSEISLESGESCNLAELYLNNITSKEELIECSKLLYKTQKAICSLPYLHKKTNDVVHKNFRLGLGVTGVCQSFNKLEWLDDCYKELKTFDEKWSKERGWPKSIKMTTIKPSGSLSLLSGSSPGVHPLYSRYYIRRVRMSSLDKLVPACRGLGYNVEYVKNFDGTENHDTVVIEFPCYAGEGIVAKEMTPIQQLELVKKLQTIWADNAISVTVYYKKEEIPEIKEWLKNNYSTSIKCVSFLLHSEHGFIQAPYEEISKEKYQELIKKVKPLKNLDIGSEAIGELECSGGVCPIR